MARYAVKDESTAYTKEYWQGRRQHYQVSSKQQATVYEQTRIEELGVDYADVRVLYVPFDAVFVVLIKGVPKFNFEGKRVEFNYFEDSYVMKPFTDDELAQVGKNLIFDVEV